MIEINSLALSLDPPRNSIRLLHLADVMRKKGIGRIYDDEVEGGSAPDILMTLKPE